MLRRAEGSVEGGHVALRVRLEGRFAGDEVEALRERPDVAVQHAAWVDHRIWLVLHKPLQHVEDVVRPCMVGGDARDLATKGVDVAAHHLEGLLHRQKGVQLLPHVHAASGLRREAVPVNVVASELRRHHLVASPSSGRGDEVVLVKGLHRAQLRHQQAEVQHAGQADLILMHQRLALACFQHLVGAPPAHTDMLAGKAALLHRVQDTAGLLAALPVDGGPVGLPTGTVGRAGVLQCVDLQHVACAPIPKAHREVVIDPLTGHKQVQQVVEGREALVLGVRCTEGHRSLRPEACKVRLESLVRMQLVVLQREVGKGCSGGHLHFRVVSHVEGR